VGANGLAFALRDKYPVTPGHTLVVPFREVATWFEASAEEQAAIFALVAEVKRALDRGPAPGREVVSDVIATGCASLAAARVALGRSR